MTPQLETEASRVLIAVEAYYPDEAGTPFLLTQLARAMARQGTLVTVVTSTPGESVDADGVEVVRTGAARQTTRRLLLRGVRMLHSAWSLAVQARRRAKQADAVFVVVGPTLLPTFVSIALVGLRRRPPLVAVVHDLYPDAAVAAGALAPTGLVAKAWRVATRMLFSRATRVIALGGDMSARIEGAYPMSRGKVEVVRHWSVGDTVRRIPREASSELVSNGLAGYFVVQYAGNIGLTHGVATVLDGAAALAADPEGDRYRFVFFGAGAASDLVRSAEKGAGSIVRYLGVRPRSEQTDFLACCDVTVVGYAPGMTGVSVPSRTPSVLAAGRPIIAIADDHSDLARLVREQGIGWVVSPGDVRGFVDAVREAKQAVALLSAMGDRVAAEAGRLASVDDAAKAYLRAAGLQ